MLAGKDILKPLSIQIPPAEVDNGAPRSAVTQGTTTSDKVKSVNKGHWQRSSGNNFQKKIVDMDGFNMYVLELVSRGIDCDSVSGDVDRGQ